jgi:hypothetical protein
MLILQGGSTATMPKDMDQARRMLNMRIKIDVWSQGLDEDFRQKIRKNLQDLFCELPARRVYQYLKRIRYIELTRFGPNGDQDPQFDADDAEALIDGPEDVLVRGKFPIMLDIAHSLSNPSLVSHIIDSRRLCHLMYFATLNHIQISKNPNLGFTRGITCDADGAWRLHLIRAVAFGTPGKTYATVLLAKFLQN